MRQCGFNDLLRLQHENRIGGLHYILVHFRRRRLYLPSQCSMQAWRAMVGWRVYLSRKSCHMGRRWQGLPLQIAYKLHCRKQGLP
jgi:hypothetical protein